MIVDEEVGPALSVAEVHDVGRALDRWLAGHATGVFARDEIILGCLVLIESGVHNGVLNPAHYDYLAAPILDHIAPRFENAGATVLKSLRPEAVLQNERWLDSAFAYSVMTGAVINVLQGRMVAARASRGRLLFFPTSVPEVEHRARWLLERTLRGNSDVAPPLSNVLKSAIARFADEAVLQQVPDFERGVCEPPATPDYERECIRAADALLAHKFCVVETGEVWGGLTKLQTVAAIRPLYLRACRQFFVHQRAFRLLRELGVPQGTLNTAIEVTTRTSLASDVQRSAGLSAEQAADFVNTLVRSGREERHRVSAYPLIPLGADRLAFAPSNILLTKWSNIREQAVARSRDSSIGPARSRRFTGSLAKALSVIYPDVATEVTVTGERARHVTDLDVVVVDDQKSTVLVLQVKAYVTPTNMLDNTKADRDIREAVAQCEVAETNREAVRHAIEARLRIRLQDRWQLKQMIVVEAVLGSVTSPTFPVTTVEWFESEGCRLASRSLNDAWEGARDFPESVRIAAAEKNVFALFSALPPEIGPVAVFGSNT